MKISTIKLNDVILNSPKNKVNFNGYSKSQEDDDKYVKVPKAQHDLENWVFGILTGITLLQIINLLINNKKIK